jgi:RNA polymerase sigma factor for flagellar operon FliA
MYNAHGKSDMRERLAQYSPLVRRLAHQMKARLPDNVEVDDLIQAGMIGLYDALQRYEEQGNQFETYAVQRIRGAMLDELRGADWLPRSVRQNMRKVEAAIAKLQQQLQRAPTESEVARALGMSLPDYHQMLSDGAGHQLVYYEDFHDPDEREHFLDRHAVAEGGDPLAQLTESGFRGALVDAIRALPEREQQLMAMLYQEEMNLAEIGAVLGVSASRVCQLHSQAIARLRTAMREQAWTGAA